MFKSTIFSSQNVIPLTMTRYVPCSKYVSSCFWLNDKPVTSSRFYKVLFGTVIPIQNEILIRRTALKISGCVYGKRFRVNELWCERNGYESYSSVEHLMELNIESLKSSEVFYVSFYLAITKRLRKCLKEDKGLPFYWLVYHYPF